MDIQDQCLGDNDITDRSDVLVRFCRLSAEVAEHFRHLHAVDCFCGAISQSESELWGGFRFSPKALKFIEDAVRKQINAKKGAAS